MLAKKVKKLTYLSKKKESKKTNLSKKKKKKWKNSTRLMQPCWLVGWPFVLECQNIIKRKRSKLKFHKISCNKMTFIHLSPVSWWGTGYHVRQTSFIAFWYLSGPLVDVNNYLLSRYIHVFLVFKTLVKYFIKPKIWLLKKLA
jgi:hypothetical protein